MVFDIRHKRLSVLREWRIAAISCKPALEGSDHLPECEIRYGPYQTKIDYGDCAAHVVCAGAACVMPTHPW